MKRNLLIQFGFAVTMCLGAFHAFEAGAAFKITKIEYDKTTKQVLLVWSSDTNRTYRIETSLDLKSWNSAGEGIPSDGLATAYKVVKLLSDNQSFFRVVERLGEEPTDPILTLGHGAFVGADGKEFVPTANFIQQAQQIYISNLIARVEGSGQKQQFIQSLVTDPILANAVFLDWLMERAKPDNVSHLTAVNNGLRWHYVTKIQSNPILPTQDHVWSKGIPSEVAKRLETNGVSVFLITNARGEAYRQECRECGVPVPPPMFGPGWRFLGSFDGEFLCEGEQAELWIHEAPEGVCLALPRYVVSGGNVTDDIAVLGIICLGIQTSKICFFDNPSGTTFRRNVQVDISQFLGGVDLVANNQGRCSDCHAGENPFVVHPQKTAFINIGRSLMPLAWPDPKVDASWPQNPGPTALLDAISSPQSCASCHRAGLAGRFPDVSTQLPGYCSVVLGTATGTSAKRTMPLGGDRNQYISHINALLASCRAPPTGGGVVVEVNYADDPGYISAPIVIEPAYQCATRVSVRGAILDARLNLFVNGTAAGSVFPARNPSQIDFDVPPLVAGDTLTANQEYLGVVSPFSPPVIVRNYHVDFPAGLPAPSIDPTLIYECADLIAVRHVPGATITVYKNGAPATTIIGGGTGWTGVYLGPTPFAVADEFTAEISLCGDPSPRSTPAQRAVARPPSLPRPTFNPPTTYAGQELVTVETLVNGALTTVFAGGVGMLGQFSTPISWYPNFDVATPLGRRLVANDSLSAIEKLCDMQVGVELQPAAGCDALPAPRIRHPLVGNNYVVVESAVPGARIRVYDDTAVELGDGSGTVITLRRALTGTDILTVVQQLGECVSRTGYRVYVRNASAGN